MPAIFPLFAILVVFMFISLHASANQKPKRRRKSDFRRSSGSGYGDSYGGSSRKDYARRSGSSSYSERTDRRRSSRDYY